MRDLLIFQETERLSSALEALNMGAGFAVAVDYPGRAVGTFTDGDFRRAMLDGSDLEKRAWSYINRNFVSVSREAGRAEVLDLMQARKIEHIPILDENGHPIGLHTLREMIGPIERPNWAVVMAGGLGTRLRPLTDSLPKPMLKVAGRPILERIVLHLVGHGIRRIFLSVNYLAERIESHFKDGSDFGCRITYLREEQPLGTGGALALLPNPKHPVLVMNGDLITQANIGAMLDSHSGGVTVGVRRYVHVIPFGCFNDGRFEEKPSIERRINAGIYVLSPDVIAGIPIGWPFAITDLLGGSPAFCGKPTLFEIEEDWLDVGQHEQLREARGAA